jgi:TetR/AcrR family transcriptional regulator
VATAQVRFSAADRREQILDVATRLFARQGFQGTTTRQVSEHTGVTEALIFRHFTSKEDLYWAVIERKINAAGPAERMRERLNAGGTDLEVLSGIAAEILERRAKDQTLSRLLLYSALENHRLSHRFFRIYVAECYEVVAEYIRRRIGEGRFRPLDPLLAARGFLGMVVYHSWIQELYGGKRYQKFSVQQVSTTLAEVWLKGMLCSPEIVSSRRAAKSNNGNHRRKQEHAARNHAN